MVSIWGLSRIDRIFINAKSYKKGIEFKNALIHELLNEKKNHQESSQLSKTLKKYWGCFGIPILIGLFAWGLFERALIETEFISENLIFAFLVTAFAAYWLGALLRRMWWSIYIKCPKYGSSLYCRECKKIILKADDEIGE